MRFGVVAYSKLNDHFAASYVSFYLYTDRRLIKSALLTPEILCFRTSTHTYIHAQDEISRVKRYHRHFARDFFHFPFN